MTMTSELARYCVPFRIVDKADGREDSVPVSWRVGCDGAHNAVRHGLGARSSGDTGQRLDVGLVMVSSSPSRSRLVDIGSLRTCPSAAEHPPVRTLAVIDRREPPLVTYDPIWLAGFRINGRKVSKYRWGRAFFVGNAAHVRSRAAGRA